MKKPGTMMLESDGLSMALTAEDGSRLYHRLGDLSHKASLQGKAKRNRISSYGSTSHDRWASMEREDLRWEVEVQIPGR